MITNMTEGKASRVLLRFALPMLLSVLFQQFYSIADSVIAGRFIGADALAAVGASYPVTMIFMSVASGLSIGISVVVSRLFGGARIGEMKTCVSTALVTAGTTALVMTAAGVLFCRKILRLLDTPEKIMGDSALFLGVFVLGLLFLMLYNACNGIFTALGDSRTPLFFLIASSVGNVLLDLLFVGVVGMGVAGVAWATFIAQGVCSVLSFFTLLRRLRRMENDELPDRFSAQMLNRISRIAIPSILQSSFVSVGNLFIQTRINSFGTDVIAGFSAALKINTLTLMCFGMVSNAVSSFTAQNLGAGKPARVREGTRASMKIAFLIGIPFAAATFFFGKPLTGLFLDGDNEAILNVGGTFLHIVAPFYLAILIKIVLDGVLRGAGIMNLFMIATLADLVLRVAFAFILSSFLRETGIWLSWPVGWVTAMVLTVSFYFASMKKIALPEA
ncbi:MAG: MATE family efflux transporter [Oscillospiraceae bacterium]